jgi:hypothetical protein
MSKVTRGILVALGVAAVAAPVAQADAMRPHPWKDGSVSRPNPWKSGSVSRPSPNDVYVRLHDAMGPRDAMRPSPNDVYVRLHDAFRPADAMSPADVTRLHLVYRLGERNGLRDAYGLRDAMRLGASVTWNLGY